MSSYLDYNASAPIDERVLDVMIDVYKNHMGNADSRTHNFGEDAREIVETARKQVADLLGVSANEIIFTSGATESNNIAIQGLEEYGRQSGKKQIIITGIEHKAVLATSQAMKKRGFDVDVINPDLSGRVNPAEILGEIHDDTLLVSVMHVNNETGMIQPVAEIGEELSKRGVLFHVDATQSCGKLVDELRNMKYNMLSLSAHKLMGPQGVGALVLRKKGYRALPLKPVFYGGQQERGIRPGTIPVALVAGCGKACEIAGEEHLENHERAAKLKRALIQELEASGLKYHFNGDQNFCTDSAMNICIEGVNSEALMISTKQYCGVSNGSACTSKTYKPSYVLAAMGVPVDEIECSIRVSWGAMTNVEDTVKNFRNMLRVARQMQ